MKKIIALFYNAHFSYMPTQLGFEPGTGEILVEKFGQILNELKV